MWVWPFAGGAVLLRNCCLSNFTEAVCALSDSMVEAHRVMVERSGTALLVDKRVNVLLRECQVTLSASQAVNNPCAVLNASNGGACFQLERCEVQGRGLNVGGVFVGKGNAVTATLCLFDCQVFGVVIESGGRGALTCCCITSDQVAAKVVSEGAATGVTTKLRLDGGRYNGRVAGIQAMGDVTLTAIHCEIGGCVGQPCLAAANILQGSRAWLRRCDIHTAAHGVWASESTAVLTDVTVRDIYMPICGNTMHMARHCLKQIVRRREWAVGVTSLGSQVTVRGGAVERCMLGFELAAQDSQGSVMVLEGVSVTDCAAGLCVGHAPCNAVVTRCEFRGLKGSPRVRGLHALEEASREKLCCLKDFALHMWGVHVDVSHCKIEGFSDGVCLWACTGSQTPGQVTLRECKVAATTDGSDCVRANAPVMLEDCTFSASPGVFGRGVRTGPGAATVIRRCRFDGVSPAVLKASKQCSVTLEDCTVSGSSRVEVHVWDDEIAYDSNFFAVPYTNHVSDP